jgi:DNA-binding transcriptional LysR family regulator
MGNRIERIERRVKMHDLRVLMSVVEMGSMAKAAESLATSQPAISRAIADLEYSLGVCLLDRGPRGIVPTPYGHALIKRGIAIFDELKQGVQDIEFLADPTAGEVRIAAPIGWGAGFVATVIDRLARRYPRVVCHLTVCDWPLTNLALERRDVDPVVTHVVTPLAEDHLRAEVLFADSVFVIAASGNPWARRRKIRLADLMERAVGAAAAQHSGQRIGKRCISGGRTRASPPSHGHDHRRRADRSRRKGAFPHDCFGNGPEIWGLGKLHQGFADRLGDEGRSGRDNHIEEPYPDARGAAFHRLRARGGKAAGAEQIIFDTMRIVRPPPTRPACARQSGREIQGGR